MSIKKKLISTVAASAALASSYSVPTLVASTALLTIDSSTAQAACYGYGSTTTCDDGSSYQTYGNSYYGYNYNTGTSWGGSTYGNQSYGYSYYGNSSGGTNWSYGYYGGYGSGTSYSW